MHPRRELLKKIGAAAGIIGASTLLSKLTPPAFPQATPVEIEPGSFVETADYIVFEKNGEYYAKNGRTGEVDFGPDDDAATVIQNALDAAPDHGKIAFKGSFPITKTIEVTKPLSLIGVGKPYFNAAADVDILKIVSGVENCFISRICFHGQKRAIRCVVLEDTHFNTFLACEFREGQDGVYLYDAWRNDFISCLCVGNSRDGYRIDYHSHHINIVGGSIFSNTECGIRATPTPDTGGVDSLIVAGVDIGSNSYGADIDRVWPAVFYGCYFEANTNADIRFGAAYDADVAVIACRSIVENIGVLGVAGAGKVIGCSWFAGEAPEAAIRSDGAVITEYGNEYHGITAYSGTTDNIIGIANTDTTLLLKGVEYKLWGGGLSGLELKKTGIPSRRGLVVPDDPEGRIIFYLNKNQNFPYFEVREGVDDKTLLAVNAASGRVYAPEGMRTKYMVADYGGNFANFTLPSGEEGLIIIAIDTNSTSPGKRLYVYANGAWHYVDLT